jgi:hypothetical protein
MQSQSRTRAHLGKAINSGFLAECLLFYNKVIVRGNHLVMRSLMQTMTPEVLIRLLERRVLEFHFKEEQAAVATSVRSGCEFHSLIKFTSPDHTLEKDIDGACADLILDQSAARKSAARLLGLVTNTGLKELDLDEVQRSLSESRYVERAVQAIIQVSAPRYLLSATPRFRVHKDDQGLRVETNLDFARLNKELHSRVAPAQASLTQAGFLAQIMRAQESLFFAGRLGSELGESAVNSAIHKLHISEIINRRARSRQELETFATLTLNGAYAIREAVDAGRLTFEQISELIDRADRFKNWLHKQQPDSELIKAFYDEVVRETWVEKLPAKTMRWGIFTGAGLALDVLTGGAGGTVAGIGLSLVDSLVLDKLIVGWRPHHFIEHDLKRVLDRASKSVM